jgi:hypothetical protein
MLKLFFDYIGPLRQGKGKLSAAIKGLNFKAFYKVCDPIIIMCDLFTWKTGFDTISCLSGSGSGSG